MKQTIMIFLTNSWMLKALMFYIIISKHIVVSYRTLISLTSPHLVEFGNILTNENYTITSDQFKIVTHG